MTTRALVRLAAAIPLAPLAMLCASPAPPVFGQSGTVLWSEAVSGQVWTPLVHDGGRLFFGSDDSTFYAIEIDTRDVAWRFKTGGIIRSGAEVIDGTVLFASDDGFLYALTEDTGDERWRFDLGSAGTERRLPAIEPPYDYDYRHASPVVSDATVYIGSANGIAYAVDLKTGVELWRVRTGGPIRATAAVSHGTVYFGSWDGLVYAVDAASGSVLWTFDTGGIIQGSVGVGADKVFAGSRSAAIYAVDASTGELRWTHVHADGSWVESSPVYADGVVYVGSSDALALLALDAGSGITKWRFETGGWSWSDPVVTDDAVYIGALSAHPYYFEGVELTPGFFAVSRGDGSALWSFESGSVDGYLTGGVFSNPVVVDGVVFVAGIDGVLYALRE